MDSTELTQGSRERSDLENVLIIGGAGMIITGLLSLWLGRKRPPGLVPDDPTDPPPIIIKSSSLMIESAMSLTETSTGATGDVYHYTTAGFGKIAGIRVFAVDDSLSRILGEPFEDPNGLRVVITFQRLTNAGNWIDINQTVRIRNPAAGSNDFRVSTGEKRLESRWRGKRNRMQRLRDVDNEHIRISKIEVRNSNNTIVGTFSDPDIEYLIAFYNHLK